MESKPSDALRAREAIRKFLAENPSGSRYLADILNSGSRLDVQNHYTTVSALAYPDVYYVAGRARNLLDTAAAALPLDLAVRPIDLPSAFGFIWLDQPLHTRWHEQGLDVAVHALVWGITVTPGEDDKGSIGRAGPVRFYNTPPPPGVGANVVIGTYGVFTGTMIQGAPNRHHWPPIPLFSAAIAKGGSLASLQEGDPSESFLECLRFVVAFWSFVQQRIMVASRTPPDRAAQRTIGKHTPLPDVQVITLRRAHKASGSPADEAAHVEWRYQWLVNGHWRSQWYPKSQEHRTIWIMPHMKGPEDKPVKPATERVFNVRR